MKTIIAVLICANFAIAQQVDKPYEIPFASKDNVIDLSVANKSSIAADDIKVEITTAPAWLKFTQKVVTIASLNSNEEQPASFSFSVEKTAVVNKDNILSFTITDKSGQKWTKDITIKITPPTTYELFQNFPNPFNPVTIISYQLPGAGTRFIVSLKVYDMLGREVVALVHEIQEPGYYQKTFDARGFASGVYIYRLLATDDHIIHHLFQKKMLVMK
jgi:hypothetical protein